MSHSPEESILYKKLIKTPPNWNINTPTEI
jgi:hypothetical protein